MDERDDDLLGRMEAEAEAQHQRIRAVLIEQGRPDLATDLDRRLRDVRLGVYSARNAWHSISPAQQRALAALERGGALVRVGTGYATEDGPVALAGVRVGTVRNLARHDLLAWDGGAFQPEDRAVLTERGRFVLRHGRPA